MGCCCHEQRHRDGERAEHAGHTFSDHSIPLASYLVSSLPDR
jgi:hypothetical protein